MKNLMSICSQTLTKWGFTIPLWTTNIKSLKIIYL